LEATALKVQYKVNAPENLVLGEGADIMTLPGSGRGLIEVLSPEFAGGAEENHETSQSG
jgi:hypothetical protein